MPQEQVFAAFVDADQLRRWWGPGGFTVQASSSMLIRGTFRAVEPPHRLTYTFNYEDPDPDDQETLVTLTFEPTDAGTRVTLDQGPFKTAARLDLHRDGWTETLDRCERSLV